MYSCLNVLLLAGARQRVKLEVTEMMEEGESNAAALDIGDGSKIRLPPIILERSRVVKTISGTGTPKQNMEINRGVAAGDEVAEHNGSTGPSHVVYWMQACLRAHQNPALIAAQMCAVQMNLPLLIVCALAHSTAPEWWRTERRISFILEGVYSC